MPKNRQYQVDDLKEKNEDKTHPIWRGIGCVSIVFIPLISYMAASQLISYRDRFSWIVIPQELVNTAGRDSLVFVKIVYAIIIAALLFLFMAIITFVANKFFGKAKK